MKISAHSLLLARYLLHVTQLWRLGIRLAQHLLMRFSFGYPGRFLAITALALGACSTPASLHAITVTPNSTPQDLVDAIMATSGTLVSSYAVDGGNSVIWDDSTNVDPLTDASGAKFSGDTVLGLGKGIVLTTGGTTYIPDDVVWPGVKNADSGSQVFTGTGYDADLTPLHPASDPGSGWKLGTADKTVLQFTITLSAAGNLEFRYVFASEEYNEFADSASAFTDAVGFFVDGVNIAFVPSSTTPINVQNVNLVNNSSLYNDNPPAPDAFTPGPHAIAYDGFTDVFTARASGLAPGVHTIKLVIADVEPYQDALGTTPPLSGGYDSAVFIEAESFRVTPAGVPEAGATSALLALGLASLAGVRRRFLPQGR